MDENIPIFVFLSLFCKMITIKVLNHFINCGFSQHWGHNLNISKRNDKIMSVNKQLSFKTKLS